jgi:hypothetical protein
MQETISNNRPKYNISVPMCYFDFVKIRQAAKASGMTTPEYLRMRLGLEALSENEDVKRNFLIHNS